MNPLIEELGKLARRFHYSCEDCWYSCSQDPECYDDERRGKPCDCGADAHNAKVDALLAQLAEVNPKRGSDNG